MFLAFIFWRDDQKHHTFFQFICWRYVCVSSRFPFFNFFNFCWTTNFRNKRNDIQGPYSVIIDWTALKTMIFVNTSDMIVAVKLRSTFAWTENLQGLCAVVDEMFLLWGQCDIRPRWRFLCWQEVRYCLKKTKSCAALMLETCAWLLYFRGNDMHRPVRPTGYRGLRWRYLLCTCNSILWWIIPET